MANEDRYGLYEAIWTLNAWLPDMSEPEKRSLAECALRELLADGLIYLCRYRFPEAEDEPIPPNEIDSTLSNEDNWNPQPFGADQVSFAATEEGERTWHLPSAN